MSPAPAHGEPRISRTTSWPSSPSTAATAAAATARAKGRMAAGFRRAESSLEKAPSNWCTHAGAGATAPQNTLLLLKPTDERPHAGVARLERGTPDYLALVRWMEQGAPAGNPADPRPVNITVFPAERLLAPESAQQLQVTAHYSDGSW